MARTIWDFPHAPLPRWSGPIGYSDHVVIGLGGSGLAAVHRLLDARQQVTALDASQLGQSAAGRNGGFLLAGLAAFHHEVVDRVGRERARRVYDATLAAMRAMQAETPRAIHVTGSVRRPADDAERDDIARHLQALRASGFSAEEAPGGALRVPDDAVFHPRERLDVLAESALKRGAWLFGDTPVTEVRPGEVLTPFGVISCNSIIVAVDGGLEMLLPQLVGRVRTARLQMLSTVPASDVRLHGAVYYRQGYDYWQQLPDGRVALGGARDVGGEEEWGAPPVPSAPVQRILEQTLRDVVGTHAEVEHRWAATAAFTDDRLPLLEEVAPGIQVTGAYSGTGNVLGWLGGRAAADAAMGRPNDWADLLRSLT